MHMHGFCLNIRIQINSEPILRLGDETKRNANSKTHGHKHSKACRKSHANSSFFAHCAKFFVFIEEKDGSSLPTTPLNARGIAGYSLRLTGRRAFASR